MTIRLSSSVLAALLLTASAANAHVTLETKSAPAGSTYKAILRVPHGCDGQATLKVRVRIPDGMYSVKPQPKAGWTLETVKGAYAKPYDNHGTVLTEGVREVIWTGSLPDEHYDEFVFRGALDKELAADSMIYVPVVQECAEGAERWIEIPAAGQSGDDLKMPAPGFKITPASGH